MLNKKSLIIGIIGASFILTGCSTVPLFPINSSFNTNSNFIQNEEETSFVGEYTFDINVDELLNNTNSLSVQAAKEKNNKNNGKNSEKQIVKLASKMQDVTNQASVTFGNRGGLYTTMNITVSNNSGGKWKTVEAIATSVVPSNPNLAVGVASANGSTYLMDANGNRSGRMYPFVSYGQGNKGGGNTYTRLDTLGFDPVWESGDRTRTWHFWLATDKNGMYSKSFTLTLHVQAIIAGNDKDKDKDKEKVKENNGNNGKEKSKTEKVKEKGNNGNGNDKDKTNNGNGNDKDKGSNDNNGDGNGNNGKSAVSNDNNGGGNGNSGGGNGNSGGGNGNSGGGNGNGNGKK